MPIDNMSVIVLVLDVLRVSVVKAVIIAQKSGFKRRRLPVIDAKLCIKQPKIIISRISNELEIGVCNKQNNEKTISATTTTEKEVHKTRKTSNKDIV